jgi:hypothetical protein
MPNDYVRPEVVQYSNKINAKVRLYPRKFSAILSSKLGPQYSSYDLFYSRLELGLDH